ncbi:MAG: hypothetical protein PGN25_17525 [Methylorubrum populi]
MSLTQPLGDNPQGLATFDPMTDETYRAVVRRIADRHARDYGRATSERNVEEVRAETNSSVELEEVHEEVALAACP